MTAINSNRAIRGPVTAVPVVAGKGVRLVADTVNNRWVVEADETVLWENASWVGTDVAPNVNTSSLTETVTNFERIRVYFARKNGGTLVSDTVQEFDSPMISSNGGFLITSPFIQISTNTLWLASTFVSVNGTTITETLGSQWKQQSDTMDTSKCYIHPYKVVGINRIASN